jgi:MFS family permease
VTSRTLQLPTAHVSVAPGSAYALATFNFLVAAVQTGFGPFIGVALIHNGWNQAQIGLALSIGTAAVLALQLPGGAIVDAVHSKKLVLAVAMALTGATAVMTATMVHLVPIIAAQVLHAAAATVITPAIAALTMTMCGKAAFSALLGSNARWASLGSASAAVLFGAVASRFSPLAVFSVTAALCVPAILVLQPIRPATEPEEHPALLHPKLRRHAGHRFWWIYLHMHLHTFAVCVLLFALANAAMLTLAVNALAVRHQSSGFAVSGAILVSQLVGAALSPTFGRAAERVGRRPILLLGFAALPLRGLLLAILPGSWPLVAVEALDGVSGAVMGIMIPLIAADLTRRSAFLNLAINSLVLASGLGATVSTLAGGWLADRVGVTPALLCLAAMGLLATALVWGVMPETKPHHAPAEPAASRAPPSLR